MPCWHSDTSCHSKYFLRQSAGGWPGQPQHRMCAPLTRARRPLSSLSAPHPPLQPQPQILQPAPWCTYSASLLHAYPLPACPLLPTGTRKKTAVFLQEIQLNKTEAETEQLDVWSHVEHGLISLPQTLCAKTFKKKKKRKYWLDFLLRFSSTCSKYQISYVIKLSTVGRTPSESSFLPLRSQVHKVRSNTRVKLLQGPQSALHTACLLAVTDDRVRRLHEGTV